MFLNLLSLTACICAMTCSVLLAFGRVRAVLVGGIVTHGCFITLNFVLALRPGQGSLVLLTVPSFWSIIWNLIGIRRLRRKNDHSDKDRALQ